MARIHTQNLSIALSLNIHNTSDFLLACTYKGQDGIPGKNVHIISQTPPHETLKCVKDCFLFLPYDPLVW